MPRYEVYIPSAERSGLNVTFRVDAENWMAALKTGFQKLGEQGFSIHNVLVDVQDDNSLHVTDATSGRVFRIRELSDQEVAAAEPKRRPGTPLPFRGPLPLAPAPAGLGSAAASTGAASPQAVATRGLPAREGLMETLSPAGPSVSAPAPAPAPSSVASLPLAHAPAPQSRPKPDVPVSIQAAAVPVGRPRNSPSQIIELEAPVKAVTGAIGRSRSGTRTVKEQLEDVLAEVFERVEAVHGMSKLEDGLYFLLDLALEKIPAEAGTLYRAHAATGDLTFAAVRGPKAAPLLAEKLVIPAGTGIVGFCTMEGASLALSDVQKDPRYYAAVAEKLGYETRSLLCSPIMAHGRTFGCLQLINRIGGPVFTEHELGLLAYIAHQAALYLNAR